MKKVKIMLFSIALFAIVGAALAFKAKGILQYCTTTDIPVIGLGDNGKLTCPFTCPGDPVGFTEVNPTAWVCYTTPDDGLCPDDTPIEDPLPCAHYASTLKKD